MAKYVASIIEVGLADEVRRSIERELSADHLPLAKLEAMRAANDLPEANRIVISEGDVQVAVCRLEHIVAEWS